MSSQVHPLTANNINVDGSSLCRKIAAIMIKYAIQSVVWRNFLLFFIFLVLLCYGYYYYYQYFLFMFIVYCTSPLQLLSNCLAALSFRVNRQFRIRNSIIDKTVNCNFIQPFFMYYCAFISNSIHFMFDFVKIDVE